VATDAGPAPAGPRPVVLELRAARLMAARPVEVARQVVVTAAAGLLAGTGLILIAVTTVLARRLR
jgi:hypothetical protein